MIAVRDRGQRKGKRGKVPMCRTGPRLIKGDCGGSEASFAALANMAEKEIIPAAMFAKRQQTMLRTTTNHL